MFVGDILAKRKSRRTRSRRRLRFKGERSLLTEHLEQAVI